MSNAYPQLVAGRYRLMEPLGQGGMGRVWKARDEVLHRDVAIKELVPPPGLTDDERREMRERSLREARAIARLNHANVVRVFDVLRTDGDPWIVMEYVPSRSLQDVLATDGPVSSARAAEIGLGVLGALRAAHKSGVMHRDVKPGNVLLGHDGRVVLTDFGLATVPGDPNVTRTGLVLGSPAYIAPERARDGTAGPEADLWSLGALLFAAVEGQSPYARPSAIGTLAALATEPPPQPKNAGPLKAVLSGLLRKDPAQRITAEVAERLLRRASDRRQRGAMSLLDGVRRPGPNGPREARTRTVPQPRPPRDQPETPPSVALNDPTEAATRIDIAKSAAAAPAPAGASAAEPTELVSAPKPTEADPTALVPVPKPADAAEPTAKVSEPTAKIAEPTAKLAEPTAKLAAPPEPPTAKVVEPPTALVPGPVTTPGGRVGAANSAAVPGQPATGAGPVPGSSSGAILEKLPGNRRNWIIGGIVVLVLLAILAIAPLVNGDSADNPAANPEPGNSSQPTLPPSTAPTSAAPKPSATTAAATTPPASPSNSGQPQLPAGWTTYRDPSGFSVPLPPGWTRGSGTAPNNVHFNDSRSAKTFLVGQTNRPKPDAAADWRSQEPSRRGEYRNYDLIGIKPVDYWQEAADWEWTYTADDGTRMHSINRGFVTDSKHGYSLWWQAPESEWNANKELFQTILDGFQPDR